MLFECLNDFGYEESCPVSLPDTDSLAVSLNAISTEESASTDPFEHRKRSGWGTRPEPRCDLKPIPKVSIKEGMRVFTLFQRSPTGQTLSEIKSNRDYVEEFAAAAAELILSIIGPKLDPASWAVVATPCRRHPEGDFGEALAKAAADVLGIPFYSQAAAAKNRQRINPTFLPNNMPLQPNVIVLDDIITTGSTMMAMAALLAKCNKSCLSVCLILNK